MTRNQLQYHANLETARHNRATEREDFRSHFANEKETNRSNVAKETETNRSNLAKEGEASRHNSVTEKETERFNKNKNAADYINAGAKALSSINDVAENVSRYFPIGSLQKKQALKGRIRNE